MSDIEAARKVLDSLRELAVDSSMYDFGPAYEGAKKRQEEAIAIMQAVVKQLTKRRSSP